MALINLQFRVLSHCADNGQAGIVFNGLSEFGFMTLATHLIQYDASNSDTRIKVHVAGQQWRYAAGNAAGIDHQNNRGI